MEDHPQVGATLATLAAAEELVLGLDHDERRLARPADRLAVVDACVRLAAVVESLLVEVVGEAERVDAARIAVGCGLRAWLADRHRLNPRHAGALIKRAEALRSLSTVRAAALAGEVAPAQAQAIASVLKELPEELAGCRARAGRGRDGRVRGRVRPQRAVAVVEAPAGGGRPREGRGARGGPAGGAGEAVSAGAAGHLHPRRGRGRPSERLPAGGRGGDPDLPTRRPGQRRPARPAGRLGPG